MDMFDEALAMSGTLKLCRMTQGELAEQMGVSQSYIANKLRLLNFSDRVTAEIRRTGISERHARALLRLSGDDAQLEMLARVTERGLTVRECEALVDAEVDRQVPSVIGRAERGRRVDTFLSTLRTSLETLRSLGIEAELHRSYYGHKMYVTLSIEEES